MLRVRIVTDGLSFAGLCLGPSTVVGVVIAYSLSYSYDRTVYGLTAGACTGLLRLPFPVGPFASATCFRVCVDVLLPSALSLARTWRLRALMVSAKGEDSGTGSETQVPPLAHRECRAVSFERIACQDRKSIGAQVTLVNSTVVCSFHATSLPCLRFFTSPIFGSLLLARNIIRGGLAGKLGLRCIVSGSRDHVTYRSVERDDPSRLQFHVSCCPLNTSTHGNTY